MKTLPQSLDRFTALLAALVAASGRGGASQPFLSSFAKLASCGFTELRDALANVDPDTAALLDRQATAARAHWLIWPGAPRLREANALAAALARIEGLFASVTAADLPDAATVEACEGDPAELARAVVNAAAAFDPMGFAFGGTTSMARSILFDAAHFGLRQMMEPSALAAQLATAFAAVCTGRRPAAGIGSTALSRVAAAGAVASRSDLDALMAALAQSERGAAAEASGLGYGAVVEAARPIAAALRDPARALVELERSVDLLIDARAASSPDAPSAVVEARRLLSLGDFEAASHVLSETLSRRGEEAGASVALLRLIEASIVTAVLRRDVAGAAALECERVTLITPGATFGALRACFIGWWSRGCRAGLLFDIEVAAAIAARWAEAATEDAERGRALHNRAMALAERAQTDGEPADIADVVEAFRAALALRPREAGEAEWAMTQHALGKALTEHGARGSGGPAALREATVALRAALAVRRRDVNPTEWAATQLALAAALHALGEIEGGVSRLSEAVAAYRDGLSETSRARAPVLWAKAHHDLGDALTALGHRAHGGNSLCEAADAYGAALGALDPAVAPFEWALSAGAQGVALGLLASGGGDPSGAALAVERIRDARDAMRRIGDGAYAAHFDGQLAAARGLQARLGGG